MAKTVKGQVCYIIQDICKYDTCKKCAELQMTDEEQNNMKGN